MHMSHRRDFELIFVFVLDWSFVLHVFWMIFCLCSLLCVFFACLLNLIIPRHTCAQYCQLTDPSRAQWSQKQKDRQTQKTGRPVKADGRSPIAGFCLRFLHIKVEFFLTAVAKCLLMGELLGLCKLKSMVLTCCQHTYSCILDQLESL